MLAQCVHTLLLVAAFGPALSEAACSFTTQQGGQCGNGVCCPSGQCCSQWNWCGVTTAHCGTGCQVSWGQCSGVAQPSPKLPSSSPAPIAVPKSPSPRSRSRSTSPMAVAARSRSPSPKQQQPGTCSCPNSGAACTGAKKFSAEVLKLLGDVSGIYDCEIWANIMGIIAKPEQDEGPATWDVSSSGGTVFAYAEALQSDYSQRGVTAGLVGFTSADNGVEPGDMQYMLGLYKAKTGIDLTVAGKCKGTTSSMTNANNCINALKGVGADPKYIQSQWEAITTSASPSAYLYQTINLLRARGFTRALTVATCFDHALNCGVDGTYGLQWMMGQVSSNDEITFLTQLAKLRETILAKNSFNSSPQNAYNRAQIGTKLLNAGCLDLKNCDAAVQTALSYTMN